VWYCGNFNCLGFNLLYTLYADAIGHVLSF